MASIYVILFLCIALILTFCGIYYQHLRIRRMVSRIRSIRAEKEAVIELMDNIGERMTLGIDLDETLEVIAQYIVEATHAESGAIFLLDEADQTLQAHVIVGLFPPLFDDEEMRASKNQYLAEEIRKHKFKAGEGIVGRALHSNMPLLITDAEADPRLPENVSKLTQIHSLLFAPLRVRTQSFGVLALANKQGDSVFDSRDTLLLQALADQAAVTVDLVKLHDVVGQQQRLEQELEVARDFQRMLLPQSCPVIEGFEFGAMNKPALMVGGDFYDFFYLDENHLGVVIADVSGKGIPGALIMATVRANLRAMAHGNFSPKDVLAGVNERLLAETQDNVFVTVVYGILDLNARRMKVVRAGHTPIIIQRADRPKKIEELMPAGAAVGMMPQPLFDRIEEIEVDLHEGDLMLLYTDGVVEAEDAKGKEFGQERLLELMVEDPGLSPTELLSMVSKQIRGYAHGIPQNDDITMVALRVTPAEEPVEVAAPGKSRKKEAKGHEQTANE